MFEPVILLHWHKSGKAWKTAAQNFSYYQSFWDLNEVERALPVYRSWGFGLMELHKHEYPVSQKRIRPIIFKKSKAWLRMFSVGLEKRTLSRLTKLCCSVETWLRGRYYTALGFSKAPIKEVWFQRVRGTALLSVLIAGVNRSPSTAHCLVLWGSWKHKCTSP